VPGKPRPAGGELHFFFLEVSEVSVEVSVDQFSQNRYIPINNQQSSINNHEGGGADISSFPRKEVLSKKKMFVKYRRAPRIKIRTTGPHRINIMTTPNID
jgi:hypothetical protein